MSFVTVGGDNVDQGTPEGGWGGRIVGSGWETPVDQLGSPATSGSLTEKCRESRTLDRVRPAAKTEFVPALYAAHLRDSRETDGDGRTRTSGDRGEGASERQGGRERASGGREGSSKKDREDFAMHKS